MSLSSGKTKRRLLPRWRSSSRASKSVEFKSLKGPLPVKDVSTEDAREVAEAFQRTPTVGTAAEVLLTSVVRGSVEGVGTAAKFVLERQQLSPHSLVALARTLVSDTPRDGSIPVDQRVQVSRTRALLRLAPDNPMLWSDMARHFASNGEKKRALRCMLTAQQLAPNHRWLLRTMSRFLVHQEDPIAAHKLLANHPKTGTDPWLIAAELACAQVAGRSPKFWKRATDILRFDSVAPVHYSELATAAAMMELESGERKRARKLIQKGLIAPTENTLAQVFWAKEQRHLGDDDHLDSLVRSVDHAYEAEFKLNIRQGSLLKALDAAMTWQEDEPFAARPLSEIAYVASIIDAHDLTIEMADRVARVDGHIDYNLEMNRVFAVLSSGRLILPRDHLEVEKISLQLTRLIEEGGSESYHALANLGLLHYRYGNPTLGREYYGLAIERARKLSSAETTGMAAIFGAREAILSRLPDATIHLKLATDLIEKAKSKVGEFYLRKLSALILAPEKSREILSPETAARFIEGAPVRAKVRFEKTGNGFTIWLPSVKARTDLL